MKKIFKNKKFYIISAIILTIVGIAAGFISGLFKANDSLNYKAYVGSYETNKNPITEFTYVETLADVEMKNFYDYNGDSNEFTPNDPSTVLGTDLSKYKLRTNEAKYIGISTMTELAAFSMLCSPDKDPDYYASYLTFNYVLTDNIKSDSALQFIPIGVDSEVTINNTTYNKQAFSGIFNGNGYDITGLQFITVTDINGDSFELSYPIKKAAINYFAMFSLNEGTVRNFGLINPNISFNYTAVGNKFDKVAMICGENKGTIDHVYVRDLRSASNNKSGIMAFGGYIISGLVYSNAQGGELKNSYVAYNSVVNGSVFDSHDFNEILYTNAGTVEDLYVYNQSVQSIEDQDANATTYPVGNDGVAIGTEKKITYTNGQIKKRKLFGTYCYTYQKQSQDEKEVETKYLNEYINTKDDETWYTATIADFNTVDAAYSMATLMPTPILRGITYNTTNENDKYFVIAQERDYAFMYEMFNASSYFASSDFTYQIEADINLSGLAAKRYTYSGGIGATIRGKVASYSSATIGDSASTVPTIYHPNYENTFTTVEGFNAYGLFPYIKKGTIKDLNVITVNSKSGNTIGTEEIDVTSTNGNVAAFGTVCGFLDSGKIENVNVYEKIELTGEAKAFIGGAVGVLTGQAVATDVTNNGDITVNITDVTEDPIDYMKGISIGGVVGYIHNSTADIKNSLNTANITVNGITTVDYTVGGILGAGYTNKIENVENIGKLTFDNKYNTLFIAGIIGRHLGMKEQSDGLTNYGDIEITDNGNLTYICGVLNATPITSTENGLNKADAYLLNSNYKAIGQYYYIATMLTNGSNITINNTSHTYRENTHFTDVINVVTSECIVKLSAVYNLAYKQDYAGTKSNIDTSNNNVQIIDMNTYHTFSPVLNYEYNSSKYDALEISTAYNLRNIKYTMSSVITGNIDLNYTNVINGDNVTLINVRNEGNMTFNITETFTAKLYASGIIKSISANAKADAVVNGGDIKLNHSSMINGDLYIAGICYENHNTTLNTSIDKYNPNKGTFDAKAIGAINNAINAGAIEVTNTAYASIVPTPNSVMSNNGQQLVGYTYSITYDGNYIKGNINVSGITNVNYSIITNTFNIGDIFTANVCKTTGYIMNTAGIADINIGQYAYILNSANNGDIKSINLYNSSIKTDLTAAGIVARNDLTDSLSTYGANNGHSKQVIAFTINYGSIYAYNYNENIEGSSQEPNCKASGIVGMGLLNVVNVLNYGNIFGSETVSGIFGVVYFARFSSEVDSSANQVILANTINYGNTLILYKGYNSVNRAAQAKENGSYDHNIIDYSMFKSMDLNYETFVYNGTKDRIDYANYSVSRELNNKSINGSIFSIINFNNSNNAVFVVIRYLINFEENTPLVGYEPATPSDVVVDRSTIYSAYSHLDIRNNGSGQMVRDTYMAYKDLDNSNYVVYSPLSDDTNKTIKTVLSNSAINVLDSSDVTVDDITYNGVFSKEFEFYKAITKSYSLAEINEHPTDAFLSDFFQFVEYSYINDVLVEKIGWKEIAYAAAANSFARSARKVDTLLNKFDTDYDYSSFTSTALSTTSIWTKWATNENLKEVVADLIGNNSAQNLSKLEEMIEYIFSTSSKSNVLITTELRSELYDIIVANLSDTLLNEVLTNVLAYEDGYSKILADAILDNNSDLYQFIKNYIATLDTETIKALLNDYIAVLEDYTTDYFDYSSNLQSRYDILDTMFSNINNNTFYETLCDFLDIESDSTSSSDKLRMYQGYLTLDNAKKFELFFKIIDNNDYDVINTYLSKMTSEIGYYARLVEAGYNTVSLDDTFTQVGTTVTNNTSNTTIDERVDLWNKIKNTNTFKSYIKTVMSQGAYYFKATEHRNTYQSNTEPAEYGKTDGDLSYYYTSVVTPSTYFYGPYSYANADGSALVHTNELTNNIIYYGGSSSTNSRTLTIGDYELYPYNGGPTGKTMSVFIADDLKYFNGYYKQATSGSLNTYNLLTVNNNGGTNVGSQAIKGVGNAALFLYEYGFSGTNNQFVSGSIVENDFYRAKNTDSITDLGGTTFRTTDAWITRNSDPNTKIYLSEGTVSGHTGNSNNDDTGSFQIIDANGNLYTINGGFVVHDPQLSSSIAYTSIQTGNNSDYRLQIDVNNKTLTYKNSGDDAWGDLLIRYARNYFFSTVTSEYHSTRRTGIYRYKSGLNYDWGTNNIWMTWFTQKGEGEATVTSQTIDYTVDQLLELDGIYTNFTGNPQCEDERNIINTIFNYYLCTNSSNFEKVIKKALLETLPYNEFPTKLNVSWTWNTGLTSATRENVTLNDNAVDNVTNTNTNTNWLSSNNSINGTISYGGYYRNNKQWYNTTYTFDVSISNISFDKYGNYSNGSLTITGTDTYNNNYNNVSISNQNLSYNNGVFTVSFRNTYYNPGNGSYYTNITIPITISLLNPTPIITASGYTVTNSGNNYQIKSGDSTIVTLTNNGGTLAYTLNSSDYYFADTTINNSSNTFSTNYIAQSNVDVDYIDQFLITNINSDIDIVDTTKPFEYLKYNYSNDITVKMYLFGLSNTSVDYKTLLIMNSIGNETTYYKLIKKLLELDVLASTANLSEITTLKTNVGDTLGTLISSEASITVEGKPHNYTHGFVLADNDTIINVDMDRLPGKIAIVSKPTAASGSYNYNFTYTDSTLNQSYSTAVTNVDLTAINATITADIAEYVPANDMTKITADNYASYFEYIGSNFITATSYDVNKQYFFKTNNTGCVITLNITNVTNVIFYEINQLSSNTTAIIPYTYTGVYYFTDSIGDCVDSNGDFDLTNSRFSNQTYTKTDYTPLRNVAMAGTYQLRDKNNINSEIENGVSENLEQIDSAIRYDLIDEDIISYSRNSVDTKKVEIEVSIKNITASNNTRYSAIMLSDNSSRSSFTKTTYPSIILSTKKNNNGFLILTNANPTDNTAGFYIGNSNDLDSSIQKADSDWHEFIIGNNSIVALLSSYTATSEIADFSKNKTLTYFNSIEELANQDSSLQLSLTTNPNSKTTPPAGVVQAKAGIPGAYYMPTDNVVDNFSWTAADYTNTNTSDDYLGNYYLHSGEFDNSNNNLRLPDNTWGNRIPGIQNVMYKVTYEAKYDVTVSTITGHNLISRIPFGTGDESDINPTFNDFLSACFYGKEGALVSADKHKLDFIKALANLIPLHTDEYTKDITYKKELENILIQYLKDHPNGNYTIDNFYKYLVASSNEAFKLFLSEMYNVEPDNLTSIHQKILNYMIDTNGGYAYIADYINKYHGLSLTNTDRFITAAYLASDYENQYQQSLSTGNDALLYDSEMREILANSGVIHNELSIQYINTDGSFDADKFDAMIDYINSENNNDVYGIFALASSLGIQNGDFIPDNLNLASMEAYYQADSTYGYILIDAESANWRINGETPASAPYNTRYDDTPNNATTYSDSVNYAFLIEMKQLKKSIATTLFELDLEVAVESQLTTTYTMYSSEDLIEEYKLRDGTKKKAILYYVPTEYFNQITSVNNNKNLNVDEIIISTTAKAYKNDSSTEIVDKKTNSNNFTTYSSGSLVKCNTLTNIDYYNNSDLADGYVIQNAVRVVAEETSVYRYYDIVLLPVDFSFKIEYQQISNVTSYASFGTTSSTVAATDGVVSIKLESPVFTKIIKNDDANTVTFDGTSIYYELTYASASVNEDTFKTNGTYSDSVDGYLYTLDNSTYTKVTSGSYSSSTQYYKQVYVITADTERQANKDYYVSFTKATEKTFAANKTYYTLSGSTYSKATVTAGATIPSSTDYYIAGKAFTLPKGFDLSKYVSISLPGSNTAIENAFTFTDIAGNYIVKENGNADITLDISDDLAKGTYDLTINLYGCTQTLVLIKNPNNDVSLTMKYDGINLSFTKEGNEYVAESDILWGTPFTIGDLKSLAYADSYELAPNATMTVTITETVDQYTPNNVSYDVWTYNVTILVTAENGEDTKTYVHKLKEMNPFTANEAYATVYKQGIQILKPALNVTAGDSTTDSNYVLNNVTTVSYPRNDGEPDYRIKYDMSKIYYNGSSEALNDERIHDYNEYKLSVVNGNEDYTLITDESEMTALNPVELLYAGMSVQINNDIDTGTYTFAFVYRTYTLNKEYYEITYALANVDADTFTTNGTYSDSIDGYLYTLNEDTYTKVTSGDYSSSTQYYKQVYTYTSDIVPETGKTYYTLSDSVYSVANLTDVTSFTETRELVFPMVKVIKTPAVDAVVESATFINNYEALGSLATLINPAKSIVPSTDAYNKDGGEPLYDSLIAGDGQKMTVDATDRSIKYKITDGNTTYNYETETDDYYIVGTTSNANLKNYAPSVALRSEYAKFFQVLSQRKIDHYDGRFNGGTTEDTTNQDFVVLNDHKGSYVYLYVLFNTDSVFLVKTYLKDMSYGEIYKTDSKTGIGQKVGDVSSDNLKGRGLYNIEFDYNGTTYKASTLNGDTSTRNSSLYMDYTKATTNNRFWYVSYVVFSEDFFLNGLGDNVPNVEDIATSDIWGHRAKFYNIAVIDISNNIRFTIEVDAPDEFRDILSSLYVTLSYNKYVSSVLTDSKQLSVYAEYQDKLYNSDSAEVTTKVSYVSGGTYYFYDLTTESRQAVGWTGDRMDTYIPEYALQLMPTAYYKFYINLPAGYEATYTVTEGKENTYKKNPNADEAGSYLPPSSLVTQDIKITITIKTKDDYEAISTWGINTSDVIVTEVKPDSSVNPTEES